MQCLVLQLQLLRTACISSPDWSIFFCQVKPPCLVAPWMCGAPLTALHKKVEGFALLLYAKPSGVWSVMFVASLFAMIYLTCFYHMVRLELESRVGLRQLFIPYDIIYTVIKMILTCVLWRFTCTMLSMKSNMLAFSVSLSVIFQEYIPG